MIVDTPLGPVAGTRRETPHGSVSTFLGIPYAEAPGPSGRFRPAPPARRQRAVRDATAPGPIVPQDPDIFRAMLGMPADPWSEAGCLTANVWAPEGARDLPVMVWVHGGGYVGGSNSSPRTDGARLASFGRVVVVALSYRLGVFGFLPAFAELGEGFEDAANLGILDLVVGLEWVRANVAAFGGDPAAVTVFGESAGAAAVATLLGMPRARGLFRRAIMQSGTAERARTQDQAAEMSARFLHASGLTAHTARHLLDWPADRVLDAQRSFTDVIARDTVGVPLPFQPVIDGRSIPSLPLDAVRNGEGGGVDLIAGTNLNEGSFFTAMGDEADRTDERFGEALETLARQNVPALPDAPVSYGAELADEIGREPTSAEVVEAFLSDVQYRQPSNRLLEARASASARTSSYLFTWPSPVVPGLGACHTLDIPFVFRLLDHPEHTPLVGEHPPGELSEEMSGAWSAFAATGEPGIRWPAYEAEHRATMILDAGLEVAADPRGGLRRWWLDART